MSKFLVVALIMTSFSFAHAGDMKADKQAIDTACMSDAQTAGCGAEQVGTGLLKCLHAYKKANKGYKFSDGCKTAMKTFHEDKHATK